MKVSVSMVTYNHERFLAEAIESALAQDLEADWELVIGEDCSTDGTAEIAREYARAHPERIRLLVSEENLGGRGNYMRTLGACRGEYVAQLDGDDYWTSPAKLRRQVELLDEHPELATSIHGWLDVPDSTSGVEEAERDGTEYRPPGRRARYTLRDLLVRNLAASCTVLYRSGLFGEFPAWFRDAPVGDWPLHALNAQHGDIGYIDEVWAAHRVHAAGVWGGHGAVRQYDIAIATRECLRPHVPAEHHDALDEGLFADHYRKARELARTGGSREEALASLEECRVRSRHHGRIPLWKLWRTRVQLGLRALTSGRT